MTVPSSPLHSSVQPSDARMGQPSMKPYCVLLACSRRVPEDQVGSVTVCVCSLQLNGASCCPSQLLEDPALLRNAPPAVMTAQQKMP